MDSFLKEVKLHIKELVPDHCYRMWIEPVVLSTHDAETIVLSVPNDFYVKRLKENYQGYFEEGFLRLGQKGRIEFKVGKKKLRSGQINSNFGQTQKSRAQTTSGVMPGILSPLSFPSDFHPQLPGMTPAFHCGRMLKKNFTFDDFVVGDNSSFAYTASLYLAQGKLNGTGVLFLLGKTGLGKSHLSQAVGHHMLSQDGGKRVFYVTAEDFTNEMIYSLRNNSIDQFKEKYRLKCDVLILEDVHFLTGKSATQKELAMTLDYLIDADKKIIFSGCERPDEIPKLNDNLKSRLNMGVVTEIKAPDFGTRVKILNKKSKAIQCVLPTPVTEYIAQEACNDVRQLESALLSVVTRGQLMNRKIDIELARSVLEKMTGTRKRITIDLIKKMVCEAFEVSEQELVSKSRKQRIVKPRQVAIFLSKKYTDQPIKTIGASFKRYHATAIYSINAVEKEMEQKGQRYEQIRYLADKLESGSF
ncbi:MAG: chromosomal replication initiator protein DnaA [Desulfobacter postgatei]|uniref:chromosomal replication initiator protein DnaA n=1 Tax=Desulfobacter postgatei TaxID=2293 RepID=UPI0023F2451F|nr:chromosomal replication initiator protein DnaA [Desulfobacter postgatei]MDD4272202.1 chromosomal replication initiator protein DnaA [Desulfobacter postgatei]